MIRKLLRWLAKPQLDAEIQCAIAWERLQCAAKVRIYEQAAYLKGHSDGTKDTLGALHAAVLKRGVEIDISIQDLEEARSLLTH